MRGRRIAEPSECSEVRFPFLFGGTFIEGYERWGVRGDSRAFPFLFGGTFIEGQNRHNMVTENGNNFPSFSEGLSLRGAQD